MKNILLFILFICSSNIIKAQDTLSMRSGENILVKVIEVGTSEIKYKKLDNLNGPVFSMLKSDLLIIKYQNDTKDDFSSIKKIEENKNERVDSIQGQADAEIYYQGYKSAGTAVVLTTWYATPIVGLVVALASDKKNPSDRELNIPNTTLMKNDKYANGFRQEATRMRHDKIWKNWRKVTGIYLGILLILGVVREAGI